MSWRFWRRKHTVVATRPEEVQRGVWRLPNGLILMNAHDRATCLSTGRPCVLHNPTDHAQSSFPLIWRNDQGIFERLCPCGIGHPDSDQHECWASIDAMYKSVHGCCGIEGHC